MPGGLHLHLVGIRRVGQYDRRDDDDRDLAAAVRYFAAVQRGSGNDICTVGVSAAVQTQILGLSAGKTTRDMNCEMLKNAKALYDMGMKVAAVSTMCQDERVFQSMLDAGTPCPYDGMIGEEAKAAWEADPERADRNPRGHLDGKTKMGLGALLGVLGLLLAI